MWRRLRDAAGPGRHPGARLVDARLQAGMRRLCGIGSRQCRRLPWADIPAVLHGRQAVLQRRRPCWTWACPVVVVRVPCQVPGRANRRRPGLRHSAADDPVVAAMRLLHATGQLRRWLPGHALRLGGPSALLRHSRLLRHPRLLRHCRHCGWPAVAASLRANAGVLTPKIGRRLRRLRLAGHPPGTAWAFPVAPGDGLRASPGCWGIPGCWGQAGCCGMPGCIPAGGQAGLHAGLAGWPGQPPCAGGVKETRRNKPTACRPHCGQLKGCVGRWI